MEKRAARIASEIEQEIIWAGWPVGRVLGSETELLARFSTSRPVLREAIRLLEHHQVATTRRGPGGGLIVTQPDPSAVANAAIAYLEYSNVTVIDLVETLYALEPMAASLAASRITEEGIRRLRMPAAGSSAERSIWGENYHMRALLAELAQNAVLRLFIDVSSTLLTWFAARTVATEGPWAAEMVKTEPEVLNAQERLAEAVALGDPVTAGYIATRHLQAMLNWLRATEIRLARTRRGRREVGAIVGQSLTAKMAPALAARIRAEIVQLGWPVGENLGSESDLLRRYDSSRAILRQALRILEYQQVVVMRRGPSGGLIITEPSLRSVTVAATLFLTQQGVHLDDLLPVRIRLELGCVDIVLSHEQPDLPERMSDILNKDAHRKGQPSSFHIDLARLAGNPALGLFAQVVDSLMVVPTVNSKRLTRSRPGDPETAPTPADAQIHQEHAAIAEAILSRDSAIARQRIVRHLESSPCVWSQAPEEGEP